MGNMFFSISYQIMLDCWRENPVDRPTFERLRNTMKEVERNHKVRRVKTFFKREKQSWIRKVYLGKNLIIIQGLKLRGVCSTSLRPLISVRDCLNIKLIAVFIFHSAWFLLKQLTSVETSIHYNTCMHY